jgi:hypothetical protein
MDNISQLVEDSIPEKNVNISITAFGRRWWPDAVNSGFGRIGLVANPDQRTRTQAAN